MKIYQYFLLKLEIAGR